MLRAGASAGSTLATAALLVSFNTPANAWSVTTGWLGVVTSCQSGNYVNVLTFNQLINNTVYLSQSTSNPTVVGGYHLQSAQGNNTTAKAAADVQTVHWNSVKASTYKTWETANVSVNCNGGLPGNGNSTVSGIVQYN